MSKVTVLIEEYGCGHAVAAVENGSLIDFLIDPFDENECSLVGSVMLARLGEFQKGINGTFVALPDNKTGFLKGNHAFARHSLVPIYVGLVAEPQKAQPVNSKIVLKGRYMILTPDKPGINISRKITSQALREDIKLVLESLSSIVPDNCGIIVRSKVTKAQIIDLVDEIQEKILQYKSILNDKSLAPRVLINPLKARDVALLDWDFDESFSCVEEEYCFDSFGIWEQLAEFLINRVYLDNGGFILIEPTSALVAVDVNTGRDGSYAAALKTNLLAMKELPRQLEVRGLGGKIVIEFAPLSKKDRVKVENELHKALRRYKTECLVVGWTTLGNLELQKKRVKPPILGILKHDERFNA